MVRMYLGPDISMYEYKAKDTYYLPYFTLKGIAHQQTIL